MFTYCGNNPVSRKDTNGEAFETAFDIVSLGFSIAEVVANPYDPWAWAGLAGDVADVAIPFVGGIGEATRALRAARKTVGLADNVHDTGKAASLFIVIGENQKRVSQFANEIGADYLKMANGLEYDEMLAINKKWITGAMEKGKIIIDIGPDFGRRVETGYISPFYELERTLTKEYDGYLKAFIRNGKTSVIGLDVN